MKAEDKNVERGRQAVRFSIDEAFEDGTGMIIECRAFEMGPRGGKKAELKLTRAYWRGLLPKLAESDKL